MHLASQRSANGHVCLLRRPPPLGRRSLVALFSFAARKHTHHLSLMPAGSLFEPADSIIYLFLYLNLALIQYYLGRSSRRRRRLCGRAIKRDRSRAARNEARFPAADASGVRTEIEKPLNSSRPRFYSSAIQTRLSSRPQASQIALTGPTK